jgi:hypothetical protein
MSFFKGFKLKSFSAPGSASKAIQEATAGIKKTPYINIDTPPTLNFAGALPGSKTPSRTLQQARADRLSKLRR